MIKSTFYISIIALCSILIACQSDTPEETPEEISATENVQLSRVEAGENDPQKSLTDKEQKTQLAQEKAVKLAKLQALKEQKATIEAEKAKEEEEEAAKERRAKRKRAAAREAKRIQAEQEQLAQKEAKPQSFEEVEEPEEPAEPQGKLQFLKRSHDFGVIMEGDTFDHEFKFYNASQIPVVISSVKASCGCTKTTYPKEPILPGEYGVIGVTFDSKGKLGRQKPFMSVVTNGYPSIYSLYMDGTVDTERK